MALALVCLPISLCSWALYAAMYSLGPAQDFMVFHTAGRLWLDGEFPLISDITAFTARIQSQYGTWFAKPIDPHPWVYPPLFLLLAIPLGTLPFTLALALFVAGGLVALIAALRCHVLPGWQRWACSISLLMAPPTPFAIGAGQNSLLLTALLVGGFGLARRTPIVAGILLGVLGCKPQLWLMAPVALVAARQWTVLAAMASTLVLLTLASVGIVGTAPWHEWFSLILWPNPDFRRWMEFGRMWGQSAYTDAVLLGAPTSVANAWQGVVTLASAVLVWWCYRRSALPDDLRLAVLLTATILAAPHVSNYDAVMVTVAV
ncbi:MAG: glycosyltransferase family 87 protein, partial [Acetobacteraceae bacterium]